MELFVLLVAVAAGAWFMSREDQAFEEITQAYDDGEHQRVIDAVDRFLEKYPISSENASVLLWKAEAQYQLGRQTRRSQPTEMLCHGSRAVRRAVLMMKIARLSPSGSPTPIDTALESVGRA